MGMAAIAHRVSLAGRPPRHYYPLMAPRLPLDDIDPDLADLVLGQDPAGPLAPERRIFVNRNLRLDSIRSVGFDLDYTLAVYFKRPIEREQFQLTLQRLVEKLGYPEAVRDFRYDPSLVIRGLVVDKRLGNLLKMDAHDHVGRAYHGRQRVDRDERHRLYRRRRIRLSAARYASLDTLFAIPEAALYTSLVDFFDRRRTAGEPLDPVAEPDGAVSYEKIFVDVRESIDTIHRDDTLKSRIVRDVPTFIKRDVELSPALHKLRSSGKRLFLLTNSAWAYTDVVMRHLLDGAAEEYPTWRSYFDVVVVDAGKPGFFTERAPFNVLDEVGNARGTVSRGRFDRTSVYARGNIRDFERLSGAYGDQILYVGDHIYGDILRSKKDSLWRTALITSEIEEEVAGQIENHGEFEELRRLDLARTRFDDEINEIKSFLSRVEALLDRHRRGSARRPLSSLELRALDQLARRLRGEIEQRRRQLREGQQHLADLEVKIDTRFNPTWGRVFKEGYERSRYGAQVEEYACVYTSRATNFAYYSPLYYFRRPRDRMAHEQAARHDEI